MRKRIDAKDAEVRALRESIQQFDHRHKTEIGLIKENNKHELEMI